MDHRAGREKKYFIPLESHPAVFTSLTHQLGVDHTLAWTDVFSLDEPELLALIPRPVVALVLVYLISPMQKEHRDAAEASQEPYAGSGDGEDVLWFRQTIGNACGLYGILHSVTNGEARSHIQPGSTLETIIKEATPLTPVSRALVLEDSKDLETAHQLAATQGDSEVPDAHADVPYHYIAFVKSHKNGHLYEMAGNYKGPLDLGEVLKPEEDLFAKPMIDIIKKYTNREGGDGVHFHLLALGPNFGGY